MYGLQVGTPPLHIEGIVRITGLLHPPVESLAEFLHRGIDDENHYAPFFLASEKCKPEISPVDAGWGDVIIDSEPVRISFDTASIHPSLFVLPMGVGIAGLIPVANDIASMDIASMDRFEPTQSVDNMRTDGYPIRLGAFVYLESEVESIAGPKASEKSMDAPLSMFHGINSLMDGRLKITLTRGNLLYFTAKGETKDIRGHISCSEFGIQKPKSEVLNILGETLLILCRGEKIPKGEKYRKRVSDLRQLFRRHLKSKANAFQEDRTPNFTFTDERSKADDRAKANARDVPFDGNNKDHGVTYQPHDEQDADEYPFDDEEGDEAGEYLRKKGNVSTV